jgi:salicylate hydroxylase
MVYILQQIFSARYANTNAYRGIGPVNKAKKIIGSYAKDIRRYIKEGQGCAVYPISKRGEVNIVAFMQDKNQWEG